MEIPVIRDESKKSKDGKLNVNFNSFLPNAKEEIKLNTNNDIISDNESTISKITKRQKVKDSNIIKKKEENIPIVQSNIPYSETYKESTNMLKDAIIQIDELALSVRRDIEEIRNAKAFKGKYNVLPNMTGSMASLLSSKITAIREINNSITQANNLDMKRHKELSIAANAINDDKAIMDTYNAFISMAGGNTSALGYTDINLTSLPINQNRNIHFVNQGIPTENISMSSDFSKVYGNMRYEQDPNIQTVVVYNQSTGAMYFDVMNISTGESIHGVERPDPMFLDDISIDISNRIARNTNLNQTYNLILVGDQIGMY